MKPNSSIGIDEYIGSFPADTQELLERLRVTIRETAPEAEEVISYQMPAFKLNGMLVIMGDVITVNSRKMISLLDALLIQPFGYLVESVCSNFLTG
jgi:hypothetical protein